MTDVDERLLTAAKLREQVRGRLEGIDAVHSHAALVPDSQDRSVLTFLEDCDAWQESESLKSTVESALMTETVSKAVLDQHDLLLAYLGGITEHELDGSALLLSLDILEQLDNESAPAFVLGAGNPETGKTNLMSGLCELRTSWLDYLEAEGYIESSEYLVLSNSRSWTKTDLVVTSAEDLAIKLIENRDVPKFVMLDEASTHFDARTHRKEIAEQFTPMAKRFAKIGVDVFGAVIHTGKDAHPEAKRLATLAYFKESKKRAGFYGGWPADSDRPADQLFGGSVEAIEPARAYYDPDDTAPWDWDLEPGLFSKDLTWLELLDYLMN